MSKSSVFLLGQPLSVGKIALFTAAAEAGFTCLGRAKPGQFQGETSREALEEQGIAEVAVEVIQSSYSEAGGAVSSVLAILGG
jgi:hypothetical protein